MFSILQFVEPADAKTEAMASDCVGKQQEPLLKVDPVSSNPVVQGLTVLKTGTTA